jgi:glutamate dehydrogenase
MIASMVLAARLRWRDMAIVRAMARYLRQIQVPYGEQYLAATLARHAQIVARIVALFHARFDPRADTDDRASIERGIRAEIEASLANVESLDDDRILRRFANLVEATVRSNYFQLGPDGMLRGTITFKFACDMVDAMPGRGRCTRSSSTLHVWRACICALAR